MTVDDDAPVLNKSIHFSGTGFPPGTGVVVTLDGPSYDFVHPEPGSGQIEPALDVGDDGTFGPWEVAFTDTPELGTWTLTFRDGECEVDMAFTVTVS